jgi:hypothetical protein
MPNFDFISLKLKPNLRSELRNILYIIKDYQRFFALNKFCDKFGLFITKNNLYYLEEILKLSLNKEFTDRNKCIIKQISNAITNNNYKVVSKKLAQISKELNLGARISNYYNHSEAIEVQNADICGIQEDLDEALEPVIAGRFIWCKEYAILKKQIKDDEVFKDLTGRITCQSQFFEEKRAIKRHKYYKNNKCKTSKKEVANNQLFFEF